MSRSIRLWGTSLRSRSSRVEHRAFNPTVRVRAPAGAPPCYNQLRRVRTQSPDEVHSSCVRIRLPVLRPRTDDHLQGVSQSKSFVSVRGPLDIIATLTADHYHHAPWGHKGWCSYPAMGDRHRSKIVRTPFMSCRCLALLNNSGRLTEWQSAGLLNRGRGSLRAGSIPAPTAIEIMGD